MKLKRAATRFAKGLLRKFGIDVRRVAAEQQQLDPWPDQHDEKFEFPLIFMFTPPYSGSSATASWLCQSPKISGIASKCEAQTLVPGLLERDRWWPEKYIDRKSVATAWNRAAREKLTQKPDTLFFFEKSPPNLVRSRLLFTIAPNFKAFINNRDPYANIASQVRRLSNFAYPGVSRENVIRHLTDQWMWRSRYLQAIAEELACPVLTYETFCSNPNILPASLGLEPNEFSTAAPIQVKDYKVDTIRNMNDVQRKYLSDSETMIISERLSQHEDVLDFFEYVVL